MGELNFNIFNIIIAAGIIHGFVFAIILLSRKKKWSSFKVFLSLSVIALACNNLQYWIRDVDILRIFPQLDLIYIQFELLVGPFFYLFVERYLGRPIKKSVALIIFAPFILSTIVLPLFSKGLFDKNLEILVNQIIEIITIIINLGLVVIIFYSILKYEKKYIVFNPKQAVIQTRWLKNILILTFIMCLLWLSTTLFVPQFLQEARSISKYAHYYPIWILTSLMLYWVAYGSIFKAKIFYEQREIKKKITFNKSITSTAAGSIDKMTIKTEGTRKKKNDQIFDNFERLINDDQLFLNPQLSLKLVAERLGISSNYLSQIVNNHSDYNFADYINRKRIFLAKEFLVDPEFNKYTIHSIALETGFNSKSSFYTSFKKVTNLTPSQYKKNQIERPVSLTI